MTDSRTKAIERVAERCEYTADFFKRFANPDDHGLPGVAVYFAEQLILAEESRDEAVRLLKQMRHEDLSDDELEAWASQVDALLEKGGVRWQRESEER